MKLKICSKELSAATKNVADQYSLGYSPLTEVKSITGVKLLYEN